MFKKILKFASSHKLASGVIVFLLIGGGYFGYNKFFGNKNTTSYVTAAVQKGTIVVSVSGSGQVSASNQIDIKPKASGNVVYVGLSQGQEVKAGTLLVKLDATDAEKSVRDAEVNLESAKLSLEKLKGPEGLTVPKNKETAQEDLNKAYDDGFSSVSNAFLDLPSIMTGLNNLLLGSDKSLTNGTQNNVDFYADAVKNYDEKVLQYRDDTKAKYQRARDAYEKNYEDYKSANRLSDTATIDALINETYNTTKSISDAIKSANNLIQFYEDRLTERNLPHPSIADTHLSTLNTYTGQVNSHLSNLLNIKNTISNDKDAIANADLDVQSQELTVKQRENALLDAQQNLENYYIRAPFDGVVAAINVKKGDSASSGSAVVTFITRQKIAEISLNEVDVAKVKVGQKVTLFFDAIPDLSITGEVSEIDIIGTVSQGVVTYNVKIGFDTQDERVKSGMSVSAAIITDMKQDVLLVPNAAVKSNGGQYVEVWENNVPRNQTVETGLSNDTMTEITSGLKEDDRVVTQTTTATTKTTTQTTNTGVRIPGVGGFGRD